MLLTRDLGYLVAIITDDILTLYLRKLVSCRYFVCKVDHQNVYASGYEVVMQALKDAPRPVSQPS